MKLGDSIEKLAKPIAKVVDSVLDTDLQSCGGCGKRQAQLNKFGESIYDKFWSKTKEDKNAIRDKQS